MLSVKKLLEPTTLKVLIRGVREYAIQKKFYTLPDRSLLKVKQVMKTHIQVEDANLLRYRSFFYKDNQYKWTFKWNHSLSRNERSRKNHKGLTHGHLCILRIYKPLESKYDHPFKIIRAVKANTLAPIPKHIPSKNLSHTCHSYHFRMHNL